MSDLKHYATAMTTDPETGKPMAKVTLSGSNVKDAEAVTPSDTTDLSKGETIGLYLGASGDVSVVLASGTTVTFTGLSAGIVHPLSVKRVNATGTTATGIVAVYG